MDIILVVAYCVVFVLILSLLFALYKTLLVYRKYKFLIDHLNDVFDAGWCKGSIPGSEPGDGGSTPSPATMNLEKGG